MRVKTVATDLQVAELFCTCFGKKLDAEWWKWKYDTMKGFANYLFDKGENLIGHYAGFPRRMVTSHGQGVWENRCKEVDQNSQSFEFDVLQIGDVMVHPTARSSLSRQSTFFKLAEGFINEHVGSRSPKTDREFSWIFGFPNIRHLKLGKLHQLYAPVGKMYELVWDKFAIAESQKCFPKTIVKGPDLYDLGLGVFVLLMSRDSMYANRVSIDRLMNRITHRIALDHQVCIGLRNAEWLRNRYLEWPVYKVYVVARNKDTLNFDFSEIQDHQFGLFVIRLHQDSNTTSAELIDIIASEEMWGEVLSSALRVALLLEATSLSAWASGAPANQLDLATQALDLRVKRTDLPFLAAAGIWAAKLLEDRLWLMAGDTDFR